MPVTFGTSSEAGSTSSTALALPAITKNSGEILVVLVGCDDTTSVSTIDTDVDTNAFTLRGTATNTGQDRSEIWYALDGAITNGSRTVTVNFNTGNRVGAAVLSFAGAGTPDNYVSNNGDTQSSPDNLTPGGHSDDTMMVNVQAGAQTVSLEANQTSVLNQNNGGRRQRGSYKDGVNGGTIGINWVPGTADLAHSACRIPEAGGGGPTGPNMLSLLGVG